MGNKAMTAEELRAKGLEMLRKAREKECRDRDEKKALLGALVELQIANGFVNFDLPAFIEQVEQVTGKPLAR